jgi:hypothetical protein
MPIIVRKENYSSLVFCRFVVGYNTSLARSTVLSPLLRNLDLAGRRKRRLIVLVGAASSDGAAATLRGNNDSSSLSTERSSHVSYRNIIVTVDDAFKLLLLLLSGLPMMDDFIINCSHTGCGMRRVTTNWQPCCAVEVAAAAVTTQ